MIEIAPEYEALLRGHGLDSPAALLAWQGVVVGGHGNRHVEQVELRNGDRTLRFFLKKERRVSWRDRFVSGWQGFGWRSKSVREARLLARAGGVGPVVVACGEEGHRAFLLLRGEEGMQDLRQFLAEACDRTATALALGAALALLHEGGFDHPDLSAKHILVGAGRFCFLDWPRTRQLDRVSWTRRLRALATLDATLAESLASERDRLRCLRAYLVASQSPLPLRRAAAQARAYARRLLARRRVRDQRQGPLSTPQHLVRLDDRLWVTPAFLAQLRNVPEPQRAATVRERVAASLLDGRTSLPQTVVRRSHAPLRDSAEWNLAGTLFRLERFGVPCPHLLALGEEERDRQRISFLLLGHGDATPLAAAFPGMMARARAKVLREAGAALARLHDAGYTMRPKRALQALAVTEAGTVTLALLDNLRRDPTRGQGLVIPPSDLAGWRRTDLMRLALGYLGRRRLESEGRRWLRRVLHVERQAA